MELGAQLGGMWRTSGSPTWGLSELPPSKFLWTLHYIYIWLIKSLAIGD